MPCVEMPDLSNIEIAQLPQSLQTLIDCIGLESAYRLTCAFGGRPKYIPKHRSRTKLADVLPPNALDALIKRFAGLALEIPKADHFQRQLRNQQIQKESANGLSRSLLADKYGLSLRQIGNIRRQDCQVR
nr:Mor transcription activator family protein [Pseudomonas sp. NMI795_08]